MTTVLLDRLAPPASHEAPCSTATERFAVRVLAAPARLADKVEAARGRESAMRWVWIVLIGILVVAAAAGFIYCRSRGYSGFTGNIEAVRGPFGVKIGVKIGCY